MGIFDTHAHYEDEAFDEDREAVLASLNDNGISNVVNVGSSVDTCHRTVNLIADYEWMCGAIGIHPSELRGVTDADMKWIHDTAAADKKIVAIGEIGLDYHYDDDNKDLQKYYFARQINMAKKLNMPIIVHSREAAKDTLDIMTSENAGECGGVIHCFSYPKEEAAKYLNMGFYIGIGGASTFKNNHKTRDVIEYTPLERIVLETDCPYMSPVPHRGERNSSLNLPAVAMLIAQIKGVSYEKVVEATCENARRMYRI